MDSSSDSSSNCLSNLVQSLKLHLLDDERYRSCSVLQVLVCVVRKPHPIITTSFVKKYCFFSSRYFNSQPWLTVSAPLYFGSFDFDPNELRSFQSLHENLCQCPSISGRLINSLQKLRWGMLPAQLKANELVVIGIYNPHYVGMINDYRFIELHRYCCELLLLTFRLCCSF